MFQNLNLLVFAVAFIGCVLTTPMVTRLASWAGAIDRPDQFRRIHKGAVPRLGGVALALGLGLAAIPAMLWMAPATWETVSDWFLANWPLFLAGLIVLSIGVLDDTRGMQPRMKLAGQAAAALVLIAGGIRITRVSILGLPLSFSAPITIPMLEHQVVIDPISILITLAWFLGCMNIWNLIDGMDGLASGVGFLVSGTMMFVAIRQGHAGAAALAAALAGGLAGFLLYNWHPACIFLGDSGSLLIGLLIGVIGVQASMKGTATVSILFPILAMGLPISDTAMAIFRRWVRDLPLSSADRRHIHHLLIGLGLNPRQAAILLYCFSGFLCGVVLIGVALNNPVQGEFLALVLGVSGCLAFLIILTSRRDELTSLTHDLKARFTRKTQERNCARLTWEAIQRVELCEDSARIWDVLSGIAGLLGCDGLRMTCARNGRELFTQASGIELETEPVSGSTASFRLKSGDAMRLAITLHQVESAEIDPDIAFRSLQRLALAIAERLERLHADLEAAARTAPRPLVVVEPKSNRNEDDPPDSAFEMPVVLPPGREVFRWFRWTTGWRTPALQRRGWLGEK